MQAYLGLPNLLDLTEGNPRWVLNLADALLIRAKEAGQPAWSQGVQSQAIVSFVNQFVAKLRVYPVGSGASRYSPYDFVAVLGKGIADSLYGGPFNPEPRMSFAVDELALQQYGSFIRTCIDLGALVIARRDEAPAPLISGNPSHGLLDVRVRLSYRLAPHFRIPLRFTKEQKLSAALKGGDLLGAQHVAAMVSARDDEVGEDSTNQGIQQRLL